MGVADRGAEASTRECARSALQRLTQTRTHTHKYTHTRKAAHPHAHSTGVTIVHVWNRNRNVAQKHIYTARRLPRYINVPTSRFPTCTHAQTDDRHACANGIRQDRPTSTELEGQVNARGQRERDRDLVPNNISLSRSRARALSSLSLSLARARARALPFSLARALTRRHADRPYGWPPFCDAHSAASRTQTQA